MTQAELARALGRAPSATDQIPGLYTDKRIGVTPLAHRKAPVRAVRLIYDDPYWICLVNDELTAGSGVTDPMDIPFVLWNAPFWPTTPEVYAEVLRLAQEQTTREEA